MKGRHYETELLAGSEGGLLLDLAQQMVLYRNWDFATICRWYWGCDLELALSTGSLACGSGQYR